MDIHLVFWIKKAISFWLTPLSFGFLIAIIGVWFLFRNKLLWAKILIAFSLVWIVSVTSAPIGNLLLSPLENQYQRLEIVPKNVNHILLLGGDRRQRTWEAIRLYKQLPDAKIVTSGFSMYDTVSDADKTRSLLRESGVKPENILRQGEARDTVEEALAIQKTLGDEPFLLVTSAYHMPRAMLIFESLGLQPIPAPGDFNCPEEDGITSVLKGKQLRKSEKAIHEYIGLLWIKLKSLV